MIYTEVQRVIHKHRKLLLVALLCAILINTTVHITLIAILIVLLMKENTVIIQSKDQPKQSITHTPVINQKSQIISPYQKEISKEVLDELLT